jgi:hypothetical protein
MLLSLNLIFDLQGASSAGFESMLPSGAIRGHLMECGTVGDGL